MQYILKLDKELCFQTLKSSLGLLQNTISAVTVHYQLLWHLLRPVLARASLLQETAKKSSWLVTGYWNRGPLKILNGIKLILDDQGNHLDTFEIIQVLQRSPILQTSNWSGTFFAVPFNKPALDRCLAYNEHTRRKLLYFVSYFAVKKCQNLIFKGNY